MQNDAMHDAMDLTISPVSQRLALPRMMQNDAERCRTEACAALHPIEVPWRNDAISRNERPQRRRQTAENQWAVIEVPKGSKLNGHSNPPQRQGDWYYRTAGFPLRSLTRNAFQLLSLCTYLQ